MSKKKNNSNNAGGTRKRYSTRRQRTKTNRYSDDNPSTFTTKKKKRKPSSSGERTLSVNCSRGAASDTGPGPAFAKEEKKQQHKGQQGKPSGSITTSATKRKRPSSISPLPDKNNTAFDTDNANAEQDPIPIVPNDVAVPHTLSLAPIIPITCEDDVTINVGHSTSSSRSASIAHKRDPLVFGRGLGMPSPPENPSWKTVPYDDFYFRDDYNKVYPIVDDETSHDSFSASPVTSVITCLHMKKDDPLRWMAVGDTAGFVTLYSLSPQTCPVYRIDKSWASIRECERQQDWHYKNWLNKNSATYRLNQQAVMSRKKNKLIAKSPNAIQTILWVKNTLIILTNQELQCFELSPYEKSCNKHKIVWTISVQEPPSQNNITNTNYVNSALMDLDITCKKILWTTWGYTVLKNKKNTKNNKEKIKYDKKIENSVENTETERISWPLLLLDLEKNGVNDDSGNTSSSGKKIDDDSDNDTEGNHENQIKINRVQPINSNLLQEDQNNNVTKCHAAVWDISTEHRYLYASSTNNTNQFELQLFLVQDNQVIQKTNIPTTTQSHHSHNYPEVQISQSPKGTYTLVAGSRGVRVYQTDTLSLLQVYGEGVALHGKMVVWQKCFILPIVTPSSSSLSSLSESNNNLLSARGEDSEYETPETFIRKNNKRPDGPMWIECQDTLSKMPHLRQSPQKKQKNKYQLQKKQQDSHNQNKDASNEEIDWLHRCWVVGVPHAYRGPKELAETLYFWRGSGGYEAKNVPSWTLHAPTKSGGVQSIHPIMQSTTTPDDATTMLRFIMSTLEGKCWQLKPTFKTDFSGVMYPPGYLTIQDNLEYIEDEDELDDVVPDSDEEDYSSDEDDYEQEEEVIISNEDSSVDDELAEAMRISLLEVKKRAKLESEDNVLIVDDDESDEDDASDNAVVDVPCEPELILRFRRDSAGISTNTETPTSVGNYFTSTSAKNFVDDLLSLMPQGELVREKLEEQNLGVEENGENSVGSDNNKAGSTSSATKLGRGKRTKVGNLESLLKSSINSSLQNFMYARDRCWADGSGSFIKEEDKNCFNSPVEVIEHSRANKDESTAAGKNKGNEDIPSTNTDEEAATLAGKEHDAIDGTVTTKQQFPREMIAKPQFPPALVHNEQTVHDDNTVRRPVTFDNNEEKAKVDDKAAKEESTPFTRIISTEEREAALELLLLFPSPNMVSSTEKFRDNGISRDNNANYNAHSATDNSVDANVLVGISMPNTSATGNFRDTKKLREVQPLHGIGTAILPPTQELHASAQDMNLYTKGQTSQHEDKYFADNNSTVISVDADRAQSSTLNRTIVKTTPVEPLNTESAQGTNSVSKMVANSENHAPADNMNEKTHVRVEASEKDYINNNEKIRSARNTCVACRGRMVIHSCGKRELPIDFDAIAKAEKERKEKEEEEKRRLKAEKLRLAAAKRKETKRKKREDEERKKQEEEDRKKLEEEEKIKREEERMRREEERVRREEERLRYEEEMRRIQEEEEEARRFEHARRLERERLLHVSAPINPVSDSQTLSNNEVGACVPEISRPSESDNIIQRNGYADQSASSQIASRHAGYSDDTHNYASKAIEENAISEGDRVEVVEVLAQLAGMPPRSKSSAPTFSDSAENHSHPTATVDNNQKRTFPIPNAYRGESSSQYSHWHATDQSLGAYYEGPRQYLERPSENNRQHYEWTAPEAHSRNMDIRCAQPNPNGINQIHNHVDHRFEKSVPHPRQTAMHFQQQAANSRPNGVTKNGSTLPSHLNGTSVASTAGEVSYKSAAAPEYCEGSSRNNDYIDRHHAESVRRHGFAETPYPSGSNPSHKTEQTHNFGKPEAAFDWRWRTAPSADSRGAAHSSVGSLPRTQPDSSCVAYHHMQSHQDPPSYYGDNVSYYQNGERPSVSGDYVQYQSRPKIISYAEINSSSYNGAPAASGGSREWPPYHTSGSGAGPYNSIPPVSDAVSNDRTQHHVYRKT